MAQKLETITLYFFWRTMEIKWLIKAQNTVLANPILHNKTYARLREKLKKHMEKEGEVGRFHQTYLTIKYIQLLQRNFQIDHLFR